MLCPRCGPPSENKRFCSRCGLELQQTETPIAPGAETEGTFTETLTPALTHRIGPSGALARQMLDRRVAIRNDGGADLHIDAIVAAHKDKEGAAQEQRHRH